MHRVHTKVNHSFSDYNFKSYIHFPSNLVHSISDKCLRMWHKNYPLHLMYILYVCTLPCKVMRVKIVTIWCNVTLLLAKTRGLRQQQFFLWFKHIIYIVYMLLWTFEVFTTRFNTRCQMVTPLLYCTCMMTWSAITSSINSHEYCVYYIGNVSLTK